MNGNKLLIFTLVICLTVGIFLGGCGKTNNEVSEEYDFSVFLGSLDEPIEIDSILTEYEEMTGLKIKPVVIPKSKDNRGTLESLMYGTTPPAVYAVANDIETDWLSAGGFIADFSDLDTKGEGTSLPYILEGYGFAYDRLMFENIFGKEVSGNLLSDLRSCTYEDWAGFIGALDDYINDRSAGQFNIKGHSYSFPAKKSGVASDLNGVFAFSGANSDIYGYSIMDILTQTADIQSWIDARTQSSSAAIEVMNPTLTTYIDGLDLITSHLSGKYSAGIRSNSFTNEEYYSIYLTDAMFMQGKAVFTMIGSSRYSEIKSLNARRAESLEFLPIKMPYSESVGGKTTDGAVLNSSIPADVAYSLYINKALPEDIQKKAYDFLIWFMDKDEHWSDPLSRSVKTYVEKGDVLKYDFRPDVIKDWNKTIFDDKGVKVFLRKEIWNDEYKDTMKAFMVEKWMES